MEYHRLCYLLGQLKKSKILVVGDLMLDRYIWGKVDRISPEAPIQVFSVLREEFRLGGAGNAIQNLLNLGAEVESVGVLGTDWAGEKILSLLKDQNVKIKGVFQEPSFPTTIKSRLIAKNQQVLRMDRELQEDFPSALQKQLKEYLENIELSSFSAIVISDYGKGVISEDMLEYIIWEGKKYGIPTLVDPKGVSYSRYRGATVITPNQREAERATSISVGSKRDVRKIAKKLYQELELKYTVITLGEKGIFLWDGEEEFHVQGKSRPVYDVTGAGDTVIAALAMALASQIPIQDGIELANYIASLVVEELGAVSFTPLEIMERARKENRGTGKLLTLQEGKLIAENLRKKGKKLVFTNGCFDLLHPGHLHLLEFASKQGDYLMVGLNSDISIQKIKGSHRPFLNQEARVAILSSLPMVDGIILFDSPTPRELVSQLLPQVLVKGEEYKNRTVIGRDIVEERGGKVIFAPRKDGFSTTQLAKEIGEKISKEDIKNRVTWELEKE